MHFVEDGVDALGVEVARRDQAGAKKLVAQGANPVLGCGFER